MEWLNYHHLLYFWLTAREGSLQKACEELRLAPSTVSKQIHQLEDLLGHKLFEKRGRRLELTESGRVAQRYAEEIFNLGQELLDTLRDRPVGRPLRVTVGVADVVHKLVAQRVLEQALRLEEPVRLVCREDRPVRLLRDLAAHELDLVLTDAPAPPGAHVRVYNHLLGESDISFFAAPELARRLRKDWPRSLDGAPVLLPAETSELRRGLEQWFAATGVRPRVVGDFEDSALLAVFGARGLGAFPAPTVLAAEVERAQQVRRVGRVPLRERLYAVSVERRIQHPAVAAICEAARTRVFVEALEPLVRPPRRRAGSERTPPAE
ncbi:MAG: transcriptional activator NhaR [Candidatus Delongbacteria bacterium]